MEVELLSCPRCGESKLVEKNGNFVCPVCNASFTPKQKDDFVEKMEELRARTKLSGAESRTAAFEFDETPPPPLTLPTGKAFQVPYRAQRPAPPAPAALLPASLARSGVEGLAEAAEKARPRDAELLALPDSLKEK